MNLKRVLLSLFVLLSLCVLAVAQQEVEYRVTASALNVRSGPGTGYGKVGLLHRGTIVTGTPQGDWVKLNYPANPAYASTKYLEFIRVVEPEPQAATAQSRHSDGEGLLAKVWNFFKIAFIIIAFLLIFAFKDQIMAFLGMLLGLGLIVGVVCIVSNWIFGTSVPGFILIGLFLAAVIVGWMNDNAAFFENRSGVNWFTTIFMLPLLPATILFFFLNRLQFFIQKPWRVFLKRPNGVLPKLIRRFPETSQAIEFAAYAVTYVLATPLRVANAIFYNLVFRGIVSFCDGLMELISPKLSGARHKKGWEYLCQWVLQLPLRFASYSLKFMGVMAESAVMVLVDSVVPTLTMFHGTGADTSALITKPGQWIVGNGNYAGSGIYFGISWRTACHYTMGAIILSRVTLGRTINLTTCPSWVTNGIGGYNTWHAVGKRITNWGLAHDYVSSEWWRIDAGWWEYCMLDPTDDYDYPWRIRPICVYNAGAPLTFKRIWGGMSFWIIDKLMK